MWLYLLGVLAAGALARLLCLALLSPAALAWLDRWIGRGFLAIAGAGACALVAFLAWAAWLAWGGA